MIKIFFIILLSISSGNVFAQTRVVNKIIIPEKRGMAWIHKNPAPAHLPEPAISKATEPVSGPLLFFNGEPMLNFTKKISRLLFIFTELSVADVLEGSMNNVKPGMVNTYDDHITELFKDAPSLVKLKCIIRL